MLYLTADAEDRYTRFDFNTGPGQGSAVAFETYNGLGLRVLRHDVWGRNFPEAYDGASPGSPLLSSDQTLFTPGLMQQDSGTQHFYQTDALGSVRGFTNDAQAPLGEVYFDAFGLPSVRQGSMPWPLGFAGASGYQTDTDTGLMLLGNRYYDPSVGRFLSPDKVHDGNNWYAYCGNNPLTRTDPTGNVFQVSPTTMTSQGQLHGMLEGTRGSLEDDGWNHSFDAYSKNPPTPAKVDNGSSKSLLDSIGSFVDANLFGGLAAFAGNLQGKVDSGNGSRLGANLATAALFGAIIITAATFGEDEAAVQEVRGMFSADQQALIALAKESVRKGGLSRSEGETMVQWGQEYGFAGSRGPEIHPTRPGWGGSYEHFHIGPINHIPLVPEAFLNY